MFVARPSPPPQHRVISPAVRYQKNGLVAVEPVPEHLLSRTQHNASTNLLSLPPKIRNMIFQDVLGGFEIVMLGDTAEIYDPDPNQPGEIRDAFALLRVCRQTYSGTAVLPYALNSFVAMCRLERDSFAAALNFGQLDAIQTMEVRNPYLIDSINSAGFGGCSASESCTSGCRVFMAAEGYQHRSVSMAMPFLLVFPNLRKICVGGESIGNDVAKLGELAQRAGLVDWKEYVLMREREGVEVVEINE